MRIAKSLISFVMVTQFFNGCVTIKEKYFSYKVGTYTIDTVKQFIYSENLISYGDYLFEFNERINIVTNMYGSETTNTEYYDTVGVYLLNKNKLYYEFDTFSLKNNIVKIGKIIDKPSGFKYTFPAARSVSDVAFAAPQKRIINNIPCFISQIVPNNKTVNDTMNVEAVLIKDKTFNSPYKMNGIKFTDTNYCIVGVHVFLLKKKAAFLQEIESMRPLTDKEKEICENMIKKSKLAVVDTIKGL